MVGIKDNYKKYLKEYRSIFEPLFKEAKKVSDFNLILSLLAIRGMSDSGWEPFDNTKDVFLEFYKQNSRMRHSLRPNMMLWMYIHLIECSEHFELIANLIKTSKGEDYVIANHKNRDYVNLKISQKIDRLTSLSRGTQFENITEPFSDVYDARLRNAIGHGDYAIKSDTRIGVTISGDGGFAKLYTDQEVMDYVHKAMALHVAIRQLSSEYTAKYPRSSVIKSSPGFGHGEPKSVTLITRANHGVIGIRCIGGYDLGKPFETLLVKGLAYESKMIEDGVNNLPASRVDRVNKVLDLLPLKLAVRLRPHLEKLVNRP